MKGRLTAILLLSGILLYPFQPNAASSLLLIALPLVIWTYRGYLIEYTYGVPFRRPRIESVENQAIYILEENGEYRFGAALRVVEVNYNVLDLDETTFLGMAKDIIDGIVVDYDVDYRFIYVKKGESVRYYIQISLKSGDIGIVRSRLLEAIRRIKRTLENAGVRTVIADEEDLRHDINIEEMKPRYSLASLLFMMGSILLYGTIFPDFIHFAPRFSIMTALGLSTLPASIYILINKREGVMFMDRIVIADEDLSVYRPANPVEYHRNAVNIHNSLNKSPYDYIIVVNVLPVDTGEYERLYARYYSKVKWAEALGRYEWADESARIRAILDRKDKGEMLYKFLIIGFAKNEDTARLLRSQLESYGLKVKIPYLKSGYLSIY